MNLSDLNLQALAQLAGVLAGEIASACNPQTRANAGEFGNLQVLHALHVGAHMHMSACLRAGGRRRGRTGAHTCARVPAPATWKKEKGDNHLKQLQGHTAPGNSTCNPCNPCNRSRS